MEPTGTLYPRFDLSTRDKSKFDGGELTVVLGEGLGGDRASGRRGHEAFGSHGMGRGSEPTLGPEPRRRPGTNHQSTASLPRSRGRADTNASARKQEVGEGDERERGIEFSWGPRVSGMCGCERRHTTP